MLWIKVWYMIGNFFWCSSLLGLTLQVIVVVFFSGFFHVLGLLPHNPQNVGKWLLDEIAILKKLSILVLIWFLFFAQTAWCCMKLKSSLVICAHGLKVPTKTSLNCHLPPFCFPLPFLFVNFRPALMYETTWFVFSYNPQLQNCSNGNTQFEDSTCTRWCLPSSGQASTRQRSLPRPRRLPGRSPGWGQTWSPGQTFILSPQVEVSQSVEHNCDSLKSYSVNIVLPC